MNISEHMYVYRAWELVEVGVIEDRRRKMVSPMRLQAVPSMSASKGTTCRYPSFPDLGFFSLISYKDIRS